MTNDTGLAYTTDDIDEALAIVQAFIDGDLDPVADLVLVEEAMAEAWRLKDELVDLLLAPRLDCNCGERPHLWNCEVHCLCGKEGGQHNANCVCHADYIPF